MMKRGMSVGPSPTDAAHGKAKKTKSMTATTLSDPSSSLDSASRRHAQRLAKKRAKKLRRKQVLTSVVAETEREERNGLHSAHENADPSQPSSATAAPMTAPETSENDRFVEFITTQTPQEVLEWILHPLPLKKFFDEYWRKKPLVIKRKNNNYYKTVLSSAAFDTITRENYIKYGVNLDLTRYEDGVRTTENPDGRVHANFMWSMHQKGCSIRMLNPQTYHKPLWAVISKLQEYFSCMVGCNSYLTPPGSQGFAPHYDDIEAFILQTEGEKHWQLYSGSPADRISRVSSGNLKQDQIGQPILQVTLTAGDLLYFPRGFIHQAKTPSELPSLHVTLSTYQLFDWVAYFEKLFAATLDQAKKDGDLCDGLPLQTLQFMGSVHRDKTDPRRSKFIKHAQKLLEKMVHSAPFDDAADGLALDFLHTSMPTLLSSEEMAMSGKAKPPELHDAGADLHPSDSIRLARPHTVRLVPAADSMVKLYYNADNGMTYKAEEPQSVEFEEEFAEALKLLICTEAWLTVRDLPLEEEDAVGLATVLFDMGLLLRQEHAEEDDEDDANFAAGKKDSGKKKGKHAASRANPPRQLQAGRDEDASSEEESSDEAE